MLYRLLRNYKSGTNKWGDLEVNLAHTSPISRNMNAVSVRQGANQLMIVWLSDQEVTDSSFTRSAGFLVVVSKGKTIHFMVFSTVFNSIAFSTYACFLEILLPSTLHNFLSKPLAPFPHNHCRNNGQQWERNESCRNDYHQPSERILAEPGIKPVTSCFQVLYGIYRTTGRNIIQIPSPVIVKPRKTWICELFLWFDCNSVRIGLSIIQSINLFFGSFIYCTCSWGFTSLSM